MHLILSRHRECVGQRIGGVLADASERIGSVLADASVESDSLPLPYSAAAGKE